MESEVGVRARYGQHNSTRIPSARLPVISNLGFFKILRLEIALMSYDVKMSGERIRYLRTKAGLHKKSCHNSQY